MHKRLVTRRMRNMKSTSTRRRTRKRCTMRKRMMRNKMNRRNRRNMRNSLRFATPTGPHRGRQGNMRKIKRRIPKRKTRRRLMTRRLMMPMNMRMIRGWGTRMVLWSQERGLAAPGRSTKVSMECETTISETTRFHFVVPAEATRYSPL